jgi:hypothetical protein
MKKHYVIFLLLSAFPFVAFAADSSTSPGADAVSAPAGPPAPVKKKRHKKGAKKAASTTPESIEPIPDGDSCGLGWKVTDKRTLSAVITRGTTNVFVPPTFGMTSGTVGCKQIPLSKRDEQGLEYAYNNRDVLNLEMAEGRGEFLRGFAESMGCADSSYPEFAHELQNHYREITRDGSESGIQLFNSVRTEIRSDTLLAASCGAV